MNSSIVTQIAEELGFWGLDDFYGSFREYKDQPLEVLANELVDTLGYEDYENVKMEMAYDIVEAVKFLEIEQ